MPARLLKIRDLMRHLWYLEGPDEKLVILETKK